MNVSDGLVTLTTDEAARLEWLLAVAVAAGREDERRVAAELRGELRQCVNLVEMDRRRRAAMDRSIKRVRAKKKRVTVAA